jgi:hypothetical protein
MFFSSSTTEGLPSSELQRIRSAAVYELKMNGLSIRSPPLQARESQGLQNFHLFPKLPPEIREKIWSFSAGARSIRVRPLVARDRLSVLRRGKKSVLDIQFSYKGTDPIVALWVSRESRSTVLLHYNSRPIGGRTIYFCPDRDTVVFTGLGTAIMTLAPGARLGPTEISELLGNTCELEARQFPDTSTIIEWGPCEKLDLRIKICDLEGSRPRDLSAAVEWSVPNLDEHFRYITRGRNQERKNRYAPLLMHPV